VEIPEWGATIKLVCVGWPVSHEEIKETLRLEFFVNDAEAKRALFCKTTIELEHDVFGLDEITRLERLHRNFRIG
jgi:hypothetical protein